MINKIGVAGAGTMGSGIALAAAQSGYPVILLDTNPAMLEKARDATRQNLDFLLKKNKITAEQQQAIQERISFTSDPADCTADIIIEAIIENVDAKIVLYKQLEAANTGNCIIASNTSSLSISALQQGFVHPGRFAGMHFFNPAQVMKLVEIVKGSATEQATIDLLMQFAVELNKTAVLCTDAPGFIVNRVARHYYLEAMQLVEKGYATIEQVDQVMEANGFKMGPFRLMDLIGMDINLSVSESLYHALNKPGRLKPSAIQIKKVQQGELGRKSGKGFYNYD